MFVMAILTDKFCKCISRPSSTPSLRTSSPLRKDTKILQKKMQGLSKFEIQHVICAWIKSESPGLLYGTDQISRIKANWICYPQKPKC